MAIKKGKFKVISIIDKGNGKEEYPLYNSISWEEKAGESSESVMEEVKEDLRLSAKRYFISEKGWDFYDVKSITKI